MTLAIARHGRFESRRRRRPEPPRTILARAAGALACALALALLLLGAPGASAQQAAPAGTTTSAQAQGAKAGGESAPSQESQPIPEGDEGGPAGAVSSGAGGAIGRLFIGLVIVLALVVGVWLILRRVQRSRLPGAAGDGTIEVIATTPLGPNRALHLVRVGGQRFLVGVTEQSVSPLTRVDDDDDLDMGAIVGDGGFDSFGVEDARLRAGATATQPGSPRPSWADPPAPRSFVDRLRAATARRN